jgi:biopolymer transport protein TolR
MGRYKRRHRFELNADVNVVSLIDVMLLLLVIFMITAPMMQGGVDITLPATEAKPLESKDGLTVSVNRQGLVFIGDEKFSVSQFRVVFKAISKNKTRNGVYLRADKDVPYGIIAQLMAIMNASGVSNVGLVTEPEEIH